MMRNGLLCFEHDPVGPCLPFLLQRHKLNTHRLGEEEEEACVCIMASGRDTWWKGW